MSLATIARTLVRPILTPFTGDRAHAQQFLNDETSDETLWDEFYDSFSPVNTSAAQRAEELPVITTPVPTLPISTTAASPLTITDKDKDWTLVAPSIAPPPLVSTPQTDHITQHVEKHQRNCTSDKEESRPSKHPCIAPHAGPPRAHPQLGRRSVPLPRKIAYRQRRATLAPITSAPRFLVPYSPPPSRPPRPPGDPYLATLDPGGCCTIVEDDNSPMRGGKTLDDSVFTPVSAQDNMVSAPHTGDSRPQTLPHAHPFPWLAFERPRDPDELATRATSRPHHDHMGPYPVTTHNDARHVRQNQLTTASPANTPPSPITSRVARRRRRANTAAPSISPLPDRIAMHTHERHVHTARRHDRPHAILPQWKKITKLFEDEQIKRGARARSKFQPEYITRLTTDELSDHIKGAAVWAEVNNVEGYYIFNPRKKDWYTIGPVPLELNVGPLKSHNPKGIDVDSDPDNSPSVSIPTTTFTPSLFVNPPDLLGSQPTPQSMSQTHASASTTLTSGGPAPAGSGGAPSGSPSGGAAAPGSGSAAPGGSLLSGSASGGSAPSGGGGGAGGGGGRGSGAGGAPIPLAGAAPAAIPPAPGGHGRLGGNPPPKFNGD
ncbi:hypothetical protein EDB89DRAFT_2082032 [Lactarius sanguifluus]|nr:hypothetical protein EDB89DRAFT_2082032 [Lactarius sanguifluus]